LGLSDAGAHGDQLCDANFSTHLLGYWVREQQALTLEQAIWRLTGQPATFLNLQDRGVIRTGAAADLVAFDAGCVGPKPLERRSDQPGGASRLVSQASGVERVWVAGVPLVEGARRG